MSIETAMKGHVLITGGTGIIGRYLSQGLMAADYKVTTLSRSVTKQDNHICVDLTDKAALAHIVDQLPEVDIIIHCAAIAHGETPPRDLSVSDFNTLISNNVVKAFEKFKLHWIFLSSISVYGDFNSEFIIPIKRFPKPTDSYGMGKLHDESVFVSNCDHLDILRLMPVYDSQNLQDIKKRVFLPKTNVKIKIQPEPFFSICHIDEILTAVEKCINYKFGQRITQVGGAMPISQNDLAKWFPGISIPVPQVLFRAAVLLLPKRISLFRNMAFKLKKLGMNNIYEVGCMELTPVKTRSKGA